MKHLSASRLLSAMAVSAMLCGSAAAQGWTPAKNVEIIVTSAPGGSNDKTGR